MQAAKARRASASRVAINAKRLSNIEQLVAEDTNTEFRAQNRRNTYETVLAQSQSRQGRGAKCQASRWIPEISGVNTTVAQIQAQLDDANWQLMLNDNTRTHQRICDCRDTVLSAIAPCQHVAQCQFIVEDEITLVGLFPQKTGFQTISKRERAWTSYSTTSLGGFTSASVLSIPKGVGQGQVAVSGTLAKNYRTRRGDRVSGSD